MAAKSPPPKRRNRVVQLGETIGGALDPALRRRGFASRDLVANWAAIAPAPYDRIAMPDRLAWPRRDRPDPEGAVLYLRCTEGHALALAHEGPAVAAAVNRYFGYLLVSAVRLSPTPFVPPRPAAAPEPACTPPESAARVDHAVSGVADADLRDALTRLGRAVLSGKRG